MDEREGVAHFRSWRGGRDRSTHEYGAEPRGRLFPALLYRVQTRWALHRHAYRGGGPAFLPFHCQYCIKYWLVQNWQMRGKGRGSRCFHAFKGVEGARYLRQEAQRAREWGKAPQIAEQTRGPNVKEGGPLAFSHHREDGFADPCNKSVRNNGGGSPPLFCTLILIVARVHRRHGRRWTPGEGPHLVESHPTTRGFADRGILPVQNGGRDSPSSFCTVRGAVGPVHRLCARRWTRRERVPFLADFASGRGGRGSWVLKRGAELRGRLFPVVLQHVLERWGVHRRPDRRWTPGEPGSLPFGTVARGDSTMPELEVSKTTEDTPLRRLALSVWWLLPSVAVSPRDGRDENGSHSRAIGLPARGGRSR